MEETTKLIFFNSSKNSPKFRNDAIARGFGSSKPSARPERLRGVFELSGLRQGAA